MSESLLIAIFSVVAVAIGGCYALMAKHSAACQKLAMEAAEKRSEMATNIATIKEEIARLRDMRHEIIEHTTRALAEWHGDIVDRLKK